VNVHGRAFLALALLTAGFGSAAANELTGVWSAHARTRGGLGAQWVFAANGEATATFGALVDFTYTIEGNRITMTSGDDPASQKDPLIEEFAIDGDTMRQGRAGADVGKTMRRESRPRADAPPIIGDWSFRHPNGSTALVR
jgi:hypothetical protein